MKPGVLSVPSGPLTAAIATWAPVLGGERTLARDAHVSERLFFEWRMGVRSRVTWGTADKVLQALGLGWWEVFDPQDGWHGLFSGVRSRDVVAWIGAAQAAVALWDPGPWPVECASCGWVGEREADTVREAERMRCPRCRRGQVGVVPESVAVLA